MEVALELHKFNKITFYDEDHKYLIGGKPQMSATTFIDQFKPDFDADHWSAKKAEEYGITQEELLKEWEHKKVLACDKGTAFHTYAENLINQKVFPFNPDPFVEKYGSDLLSGPLQKLFAMCDKFHADSKESLVPIRSELVVGDEALGICGMVDQLYWNKKKQSLEIWDWKTNKDIRTENRFQRFETPIKHLEVCELNSYSLQLSLYRYIIEKNTNLSIGKCYFVWFHIGNEKYKIFETLDYRADIQKMIAHAKSVGILPT